MRREDGSTAVEFGLVAAPFFGLMFAIIETALVFFAGQTLETATADASRLIMTGQAQTQDFGKPSSRRRCARASTGCSSATRSRSSSYRGFVRAPTFRSRSMPQEPDDNQAYSPGSAGDIVVVRVMYEWPIYVSLG